MYKLLLMLRYLRRKLAPLFAMLAVTLCTAMVIIVISVMGGFLELMRDAARKLTGDVIVAGDIRGFSHYQELIARIESMEQVAAATPVVRGYGLINLLGKVYTVEAVGVEPHGMEAVIGFRQALYWDSQTVRSRAEEELKALGLDPGAMEPDRIIPESGLKLLYDLWRDLGAFELKDLGMSMSAPPAWGNGSGDLPGIVPGIHVSPTSDRNEQGHYDPMNSIITGLYRPGRETTLTILPVDEAGMPTNPATRRLTVVNEFKSGLYEVDSRQVFLAFDVLQAMLRMEPVPEVDFDTGDPTGRMLPGRAHEIMVRGREGVPLEALRDAVLAARQACLAEFPAVSATSVYTWEQKHATLLNAVQNEKGLITFLFAFISMVAVVMIATTFYMIVLEKTRDIGVLRAIGASRMGIGNIFISYGLLLGTIGAFSGLALGVAIVYNLNEIQEGLYQLTLWWTNGRWGWRMWDPRTYYFDSIPESVDFTECSFIVAGAILSSVLGAMIPAFLAGRLNPVEALRYE